MVQLVGSRGTRGEEAPWSLLVSQSSQTGKVWAQGETLSKKVMWRAHLILTSGFPHVCHTHEHTAALSTWDQASQHPRVDKEGAPEASPLTRGNRQLMIAGESESMFFKGVAAARSPEKCSTSMRMLATLTRLSYLYIRFYF